MLITDIIDRIETLITKGLTLSKLKPHLIDAHDQLAAFQRSCDEIIARAETLQISLETEQTRNAALAQSNAELIATNAQLIETHAKEKEEIEARHRDVIACLHANYRKPEPPGVIGPWT